MFSKINRELTCVLRLSVGFMLLFAADYTVLNSQKVVASSIADEHPGFEVDGYTLAAISYTMMAFIVWIGPCISHAVGPRITLVLSATGSLFYVGSYAFEHLWVIYFGAVMGGVAAGTMWPAQGHYLIQNSKPETTARNAGIFWLIFSSSNMLGNIFVYFIFYGQKYIDKTTRRNAIYLLVGLNLLSIIAFLALPKSANSQKVNDSSPIKTIKTSWNILFSRRMLWLVLYFCYAGVQQAFWSGIYSSCVGFTLGFGDSVKELVALSGIFMSIGSFMGSFSPIVFSKKIREYRYARRLIVLAGLVAQLSAHLITFINLPDNAVFENTEDRSLIEPNPWLAILGSVLLCFGDSCLATQIYSIIGDYYRENSAEACALFKFVKASFMAASFYWCNHVGLHKQLAIMATMAVIGVTCFFVADHDNISRPADEEVSTKESPEKGCETIQTKF